MFGVLFSILVTVAILSSCGEIIMRIRLTKRSSSDKIAWWGRGGDEVAATYEELFPHSRLPIFRHAVFWLFVVLACVAILSILLKSS
jgi:hypothetical protein